MTYTHDTIVAGFNAHVIDRYSAIQYPQPPPAPTFGGPPFISYTSVALITRSDSDVVFTLEGGMWDTLYWFGALPGDVWYPAHITDTTCAPLEVTDTVTVVIDGVPLRSLDVSGGTVIERVGSTWDMFMYCPNWIIDGPMGMRCYRDDEIFYQITIADCEAMAAIDEAKSSSTVDVSPNPGTDHIRVSLASGPHLITIRDITGRPMFMVNTDVESTTLDTSDLPAGTYTIDIHGARSILWVKQ